MKKGQHTKKKNAVKSKESLYILIIGVPLAFIFAFTVVTFFFVTLKKNADSAATAPVITESNINAGAPIDQTAPPVEDGATPRSTQLPAAATPTPNTNNRNSSQNATRWDEDGCQIGSASYDVCRKNVFNAQCSTEWSAIGSRYSNEVDRAWAVRDAYKQATENDLAESSLPDKEKTSVRFRAMVIAQDMANKIIDPAYVRYTGELSGLKNKGCDFYTQGHSNYANHAMDHYL